MTTRKAAARRVEGKLVNARVPPYNSQPPPHEQVPLGDQAPINLPVMKHGEMRASFLNFTYVMDTQFQVIPSKAQGITTQANQEVASHVNKNTSKLASLLRDFTRINPSIFFIPKIMKILKTF